MPSPFPGMDPYLEGALWTTLHHGLGTEIVRQLAPKLRPRYVALPVERFVMDMTSGVSVTTTSIYPDVSVPEVRPHTSNQAEMDPVPIKNSIRPISQTMIEFAHALTTPLTGFPSASQEVSSTKTH